MELEKAHNQLSKCVKSWREIDKQAKQLIQYIVQFKAPGLYNKIYLLTHAEVSRTPYAFFVVSTEVVNEHMLPAQVIINPVILSAPARSNGINNVRDYSEPCMMYAFREPKAVKRFNAIRVRYQTVTWYGGLRTRTQELTGLISAMYQHAVEHIEGKSPYNSTPSPAEWWTREGTAKSEGGSSI
jgi:peptide deformylase